MAVPISFKVSNINPANEFIPIRDPASFRGADVPHVVQFASIYEKNRMDQERIYPAPPHLRISAPESQSDTDRCIKLLCYAILFWVTSIGAFGVSALITYDTVERTNSLLCAAGAMGMFLAPACLVMGHR